MPYIQISILISQYLRMYKISQVEPSPSCPTAPPLNTSESAITAQYHINVVLNTFLLAVEEVADEFDLESLLAVESLSFNIHSIVSTVMRTG